MFFFVGYSVGFILSVALLLALSLSTDAKWKRKKRGLRNGKKEEGYLIRVLVSHK